MNRSLIFLLLFIFGCAPIPAASVPTATSLPTAAIAITRAVSTSTPVPFTPTATVTPGPSATPFPLPAASTEILPCSERKPAPDDLYPVLTDSFGLSADYVPKDLVRLDKYLPYSIVYSAEIRVRQVMVEALVTMIKDMRAAGLKPIIRSGYRGYYDQAASYAKWQQQNPNRVGLISAKPGHSEHQLGLAVDFASPELAAIVGNPEVEYHSDFDQTSEGGWLLDNAYKYGFTLSFPLTATTWTGMAYEPWHYRYVGKDLATYLYDSSQVFNQFMLRARPNIPCMPGE